MANQDCYHIVYHFHNSSGPIAGLYDTFHYWPIRVGQKGAILQLVLLFQSGVLSGCVLPVNQENLSACSMCRAISDVS